MSGLPAEGAAVDLPRARAGWADYLVLAKPRLNSMVLATTFGGAWFGAGGAPSAALLLHAVGGTGLVAVGASALNMVMERRTDALMVRTRERPLPSGRMQAGEAILFGALCSAAGLGWLAAGTNLLAAGLAAATLAIYLGVYTPLKGRSAHNTLVGAVPGALPPLIGWAAGAGALEPGAWVLFSILYLWQIPHFLSIAWLYREDYERAGLVMMPMLDGTGAAAGRHAVLYAAVLTAGSLFAVSVGLAGWTYLGGALLLGAAYTLAALSFARLRSDRTARRLLRASLLYLPLLFALLGLDPAR